MIALRARGFKHIEGIDWGERTIGIVKKVYPDLPVKVGDATRVDVPDDHFNAYLSLGVVEHRQEGPEPYLAEAFRVLKPGGYAFISVPFVISKSNLVVISTRLMLRLLLFINMRSQRRSSVNF